MAGSGRGPDDPALAAGFDLPLGGAASLSPVRPPRDLLDAESGPGVADHLIRILVVGGYGGFGARLTRRLTGRGHHVLVLGRSETRAREFCAMVPGTTPVVGDR